MISRHWKGIVRRGQEETYLRHLRSETFPQLTRLAGFVRASVLRREVDGGTEFQVITVWDSRSAITAFAGADIETAVVPPAARALMVHFDERVVHYDVADAFPQ